MARDTTDLKYFNMRLPRDLWMFVKNSAALEEVSMTEIVVNSLDMYRRKIHKNVEKIVTEMSEEVHTD